MLNENDHDKDGNNIVSCPICGDNDCLSKDTNRKCPKEDMLALESDIKELLCEYKATGDDSRIANVLEAVEKMLTENRQALMSEVMGRLEEMKLKYEISQNNKIFNLAINEIIKSLKHECCDGECHHDDCCGKIPANCKNLNN